MLRRPRHRAVRCMPSPTARVTQALPFRQESLTAPQLFFGPLALDNFLSELFVHSCKLSGPFEDSLLKLLCGPLLLA